MLTTIEYALYYAALGLAVLPLHWPLDHARCSCGKVNCASPAKHPYGKFAPQGLKNATTDPDLIRQWFYQGSCNIGIATGAASCIVVLDIDPRHSGNETLENLEKQYGTLPNTWRFLTGGGGEHIIFKHPGGSVSNSAGQLGAGIDLRGDGGYIVAPPSKHICGRPYAISVDHHPDEMALANMPPWLLSQIQTNKSVLNIGSQYQATAVEEWRKQAGSMVMQGQRNQILARLTGHLLRNRIDPHVTAELMLAWGQIRCQPPLLPDEIMHTVRSIAQREISRRKTSDAVE